MKRFRDTCDVAVVGLGLYGSAVAWQLAKRGVDVIGIDQYMPPHKFGSSTGVTRIVREAPFEGAEHVISGRRTVALLRELEANGEVQGRVAAEFNGASQLFAPHGMLIMGPRGKHSAAHGISDAVGNSIHLAERHGITHEVLDGDQITRRFPYYAPRAGLVERTIGYYEPRSGTMFPERVVYAQLVAAEQAGARLRYNTKVRADVRYKGNKKLLSTRKGDILANRIIYTVGPWTSTVLPPTHAGAFVAQRHVSGFFKVDHPERFSIDNHPNLICFLDPEEMAPGKPKYFYGFPAVNGRAKFAHEEGPRTAPDGAKLRRTYGPELSRLFALVSSRVRGLSGEKVESATCRYTITPNSNFSVAMHPTVLDSLVVSCCNGFGAKHSAGMAESIACYVTGTDTPVDLKPFGLMEAGQVDSARFDHLLSALERKIGPNLTPG